MLTKVPYLSATDFRLSRPQLFLALAVIGVATSLFSLFGLGAQRIPELVGLLAIVGLIVLPHSMPEASLVILGFAGRAEIPPILTGEVDIAFWAGSGLILAVALQAMLNPQAMSSIPWTHPVVISHIALFCVVGIYLVGMQGSEYALEKAYRVLVFGPLLLLLPQLLLTSVKRMYRFLWQFVLFVCILAAASVVISISESGLDGLQRISPPGGGPITLARMTGFAAIACIGFYIVGHHRKVAGLSALILVLVTFATGSRGPALFLVLVLLIAILASLINGRTRRRAVALISGAVAGSLVLISAAYYATSRDLPFARRYLLLVSDDKGGSVNTRADYLDRALVFADSSGYMGWGTGSWRELVGSTESRAYPHNVFAEYFVEQGSIGLVIFTFGCIAVVVTGAFLLTRRLPLEEAVLVVVGFASYLYALFLAQTSGDIYDNRYLWFYAGFILCCFSRYRTMRAEGSGCSSSIRIEGGRDGIHD